MVYLFKKRTGKKSNNYLDDFLFTALIKTMCDGQVNVFLELCKEINFLISLNTAFWGTQFLVFLGMLIDMVKQVIAIPLDKRQKAIDQLLEVANSRKVTVLKLQKLTGLLNFLCRAIYPGKAFTRRFYAKFADLKMKQHYHVKVDLEMCLDCGVWLKFLTHQDSVSRPFIDFSKKLQASEISFWMTHLEQSILVLGAYLESSGPKANEKMGSS